MLSTPESEQALLGCLISNPDTIPLIDLSASDFILDAHQGIYRALKRMKVVDDSLLAAAIVETSQLKLSEAYVLVAGCLSKACSPNIVQAHCDKIKAKSRLRQLRTSASAAVSQLDNGESYENTIEYLQRELGALVESGKSQAYDLGSIAHTVEADLSAIMAEGCPYTGIPWGFKRLDEMTGGTGANVLTILAARPSVGKTAISLQIARNITNSRWDSKTKGFINPGHRLLYFSLEMSKEQLMKRWLAMQANLPLNLIRSPQFMHNKQKSDLSDAIQNAGKYPLWIDDSSSLSIQELKARAYVYKKKYGIEAIIVDHLGKVKAKADQRYLEVGLISEGLKQMSKELGVPVIALHHLGRGSDDSDDVHMGQLRESGNIEQDADLVVLLSILNDEADKREIQVKVAKNRDGATGKLKMMFNKKTQSFTEMSEV